MQGNKWPVSGRSLRPIQTKNHTPFIDIHIIITLNVFLIWLRVSFSSQWQLYISNIHTCSFVRVVSLDFCHLLVNNIQWNSSLCILSDELHTYCSSFIQIGCEPIAIWTLNRDHDHGHEWVNNCSNFFFFELNNNINNTN